jgi:hypothetical protein
MAHCEERANVLDSLRFSRSLILSSSWHLLTYAALGLRDEFVCNAHGTIYLFIIIHMYIPRKRARFARDGAGRRAVTDFKLAPPGKRKPA